MEYLKPHLSIAQQVELLTKHGLVADADLLASRLKSVGYYRFSAYLHPFRMRDHEGRLMEHYVPDTTLEKVWEYYLFDRKLRFLMMDAIERIEVALRSHISFHHTAGQSPFAYASSSYFPAWKGYIQNLERVHISKNKSGNIIPSGKDHVDHFFNTYGDQHDYLPLWMAVGEMEFGTMVYFYTHSDKAIRKAIASEWKTDTATLDSWLNSLRVLRNDCAHHARIWNKTFLSSPRMNNMPALPWNYVYSEKARKWVKPTASLAGADSLLGAHSSIAPLLYICRYLLRQIAPTSKWHLRVQDCLFAAQQNGINLNKMGLPEHWALHPMWG